MKTRADLLIDGKYKRITIWDALDMKQNRPVLWEKYKDKIFSISKKSENKVRLIFQTGKQLRIVTFDIIMRILNIEEREVKSPIDMNFLKNVFLESSILK